MTGALRASERLRKRIIRRELDLLREDIKREVSRQLAEIGRDWDQRVEVTR